MSERMAYRIVVQQRPRYQRLGKPKQEWGIRGFKLKLPFVEIEFAKEPKAPPRLKA